jgi:DNA-binding Lrp family transcriptional regulator
MKKHAHIRTFNGTKFELINVLNVDKDELQQRIKELKKKGSITKARIIAEPITEVNHPKLHKFGYKFIYLFYAVCVPKEFPETRTVEVLESIAKGGLTDMGLNEVETAQFLHLLKKATPTYAQVQEFYDELEQEKPFDGGMSFEHATVAMKESLLQK